jgi:hypothetical protein
MAQIQAMARLQATAFWLEGWQSGALGSFSFIIAIGIITDLSKIIPLVLQKKLIVVPLPLSRI